MKKLIMIIGAIATAAVAQAAKVDWGYTGVEADKDFTVLVFASAIESHYDTYENFAAAALRSETVVESGGRGGKIYSVAKNTITVDASAKTLYFAIVEGSDAKTFKFGSASIDGLVYDPESQQSSPGYLDVKANMMASSGTIGGPDPIPEPTSALLLVLGVAGLALRRRA